MIYKKLGFICTSEFQTKVEEAFFNKDEINEFQYRKNMMLFTLYFIKCYLEILHTESVVLQNGQLDFEDNIKRIKNVQMDNENVMKIELLMYHYILEIVKPFEIFIE